MMLNHPASMNSQMYGTPPMPIDHEPGPFRTFDSPYNAYALNGNIYPEYPGSSKSEVFDYNYWSPATTTAAAAAATTTTHNLLGNPVNVVLDHGQTPPSSSHLAMESLVPVSSLHLSQLHATTTISATHHHHHIHQHLYPSSSTAALPSTPPMSHEPTTWLGSGDYQALHPTSNPSSAYRQYSTPCSLYSTNNFYEPCPSQWSTQPILPIKFESPYSPPSYFEASDSFNQCQEQLTKEEPIESLEQSNWLKASTSSAPLTLVPPKNPLNGKTRTRDKYRIVYTDQQRYELENEFILSHYISIPRKSALSSTLALSERQIKIWFQNRRAKERKLKKKRQESSTRESNHSHDGDSPSDGGPESPTYYANYP